MASFERRRTAAAQDPDDTGYADPESPDAPYAPGTGSAGGVAVADPWDGTDPTTLPSRRSVVPRRRARDPWLVGGAALVITAGVAAAVMSGPLFGGGTDSERSTVATTSPRTPESSSTTPLVHSLLSTAAGPSDGSADPASAADAQAAAWVAAYVGGGNAVACDVTVCGMLRARGFPTAALVVVQSSVAQVEGANVVVVTDFLRGKIGPLLDGFTAAEPLAVFSTDTSTVEVFPVALSGPSAYTAQLAADRAVRKDAGLQLLRNKRITVTAAARTALADGEVDIRVCTLLATLGGSHDVVVEAFTGAGPGAGPDVPVPGVVISGFDGAGAVGASSAARQLQIIVKAQRPPYKPLSVGPVAAGTGNGLAVVFDQPGSPGLLPGTPS